MNRNISCFVNVSPEKGSYWYNLLKILIEKALPYQFEKYVQTGTVNNFFLVAYKKNPKIDYSYSFPVDPKAMREGFFYCDSDLYKWAEATALFLQRKNLINALNISSSVIQKLSFLLEEIWDLFLKAQDEDGYLFTYNQFYYPNVRWKNIQIEHELYCMGHFIEAGIEYYSLSHKKTIFYSILKIADLIYKTFYNSPAHNTPGHQEIEIALIKLFQLTGKKEYLDMAYQFLFKRGTTPFFSIRFLFQALSAFSRARKVQNSIKKTIPPEQQKFNPDFYENIAAEEPRFLVLRAAKQFLTGEYNQQHRPFKKWKKPHGHAVRWEYQIIAHTLLELVIKNNPTLLRSFSVDETEVIKDLWKKVTEQYLFASGGIGSIAIIEGFSKPYELNGKYAYCETCASIANTFWNHYLFALYQDAAFADLLEWQLYNGARVGMSLNGEEYSYRNPLAHFTPEQRRKWYATPCCPSNLARTYAKVDSFACFYRKKEKETCPLFFLLQYIPFRYELPLILSLNQKHMKIYAHTISHFPWKLETMLILSFEEIDKNTSIDSITIENDLNIYLRVPWWASGDQSLNEKKAPFALRIEIKDKTKEKKENEMDEESLLFKSSHFSKIIETLIQEYHNKIKAPLSVASGLAFGKGGFLSLSLSKVISSLPENLDYSRVLIVLTIQFNDEVKGIFPSKKAKGIEQSVAFVRGPLLYCLEYPNSNKDDNISIKNQNTPTKNRKNVSSPQFPIINLDRLQMSYKFNPTLLGGIGTIRLKQHSKSSSTEIELIPFYAWGNRGPSIMTVWLKTEQ